MVKIIKVPSDCKTIVDAINSIPSSDPGKYIIKIEESVKWQ